MCFFSSPTFQVFFSICNRQVGWVGWLVGLRVGLLPMGGEYSSDSIARRRFSISGKENLYRLFFPFFLNPAGFVLDLGGGLR